MPNPLDDVFTEVKALIGRVWPEVVSPERGPKHPIYRVTQVERRAWRDLVEKNQIAAPWVVVALPPVQQVSGWGACNIMFQPRVTIYYITEPQSKEPDLAAHVWAKLAAFQTALGSLEQGGFPFQVSDFAMDATESNPANATFLSNNQSLLGGSVSFLCLCGYVSGTD